MRVGGGCFTVWWKMDEVMLMRSQVLLIIREE